MFNDVLFCPVQIVWSLDQVTLLNPPQEPVSDHRLRVFYSCDKPAAVQLDCVVSFDTGIVSSVPLRQWDCVPGEPRIRTVTLRLPDWLVYQADGIVPDSQWVLTTILQASLSYRRHGGTGPSPVSRDVALLQPRTFFDRPVKQHKLCFPWSTQMLRLTPGFLRTQCPWEEGINWNDLSSKCLSPTCENSEALFGLNEPDDICPLHFTHL